MSTTPQTLVGKWSVGLNTVFVLVIVVAVMLVNVLGVLSYDDTWWDMTVPIAVIITLAAFVTGIVARRKGDRSLWVSLSLTVSICAILFALLHSLFISD